MSCGWYKRDDKFFLPKMGMVGELRGRIYYRTGKYANHKLQKPPGWAIQRCIIDYLSKEDIADKVIVVHKSVEYETMLSSFFGKRSVLLDRGYGEQIVVLEAAWWRSDEGPPPEQLSLGL